LSALLSFSHLFLLGYFLYLGYEKHTLYSESLRTENENTPVIQGQLSRKKNELAEIELYFSEKDKMIERIHAATKEIEKSQKRLPDKADTANTLEEIKKIATNLNIKNLVFGVDNKEEDKGFYILNTYNLKATGTYLQFLIFLEKIAEQERILNVRTLTFTKAPKSGQGRFQLIAAEIEIEGYRYDVGHVEETGLAEIEKNFVAPPKMEK
jgi:Tfp pilus assembly protein PilO